MNQYRRIIKSISTLAAIVLLMVGGRSVSAAIINPSLLDAMADAAADETLPVIIRLIGDPIGASAHASPVAAGRLAELLQNNSAASRGLLQAVLKAEGVQGIVWLWIINGLAAELTIDQILAIADHPEVESIVLDETITAPTMTEADSQALTGGSWDNLGAVHAQILWDAGVDGSGVVVASMDTGVDPYHPDLADNWRGGANSWYDPHGQHTTPFDSTGHGTQVMGIITGGAASGVPIGLAPGSKWISVKLFDDDGQAAYSDIHLGFQWLMDPDGLPDTDDAPHVVNNSWGLQNALNQCVTEFQEDIQVLNSAGIAVVFSGGNYGPSDETSVSPANYPESFAVGAVDETFTAAGAGSRGPSACDGGYFPDVSAPGVNILTADRTLRGTYLDSYAAVTGSSFAAPHAAGAMALLKDAYPGATVSDLESALAQSALDLGLSGPDDVYGRGLIDLAAASDRLTNSAGCLDEDNDGYFGAAGCGTLPDCDDGDPTINPSMAEIKNDGIDQNCNGYDLTLAITAAIYFPADDKLSVTATSELGSAAALELAGFGAMKWDRKKSLWKIDVRSAGGDPTSIRVAGIEGSLLAPTTVDNGGAGGGGNSGGGNGKGKNK